MMNLPIVNIDKIVVLCADVLSGNILNHDGSYYLGKGDNYYVIVDSMQIAEEYAQNMIKNKSVEVLLYNGNGEFLKLVR